MIISASRRTDIPAFYTDWFLNRIKEGYVFVRNPFNYHQISKINLSPNVVDCIVFWTKNPLNMLIKLDQLKDYPYYFLFTITPYDRSIEVNLPDKIEIIDTFKKLSEKIGSNRVIWRYDPIILTDCFTKGYHLRCFEYLARQLYGYTEKCIISFLDLYGKTCRNLQGIKLQQIKLTDMYEIARELVEVANKYSIDMQTCSEAVDLTNIGIKKGSCIDTKLISEILGIRIDVRKDKNQRKECRCAASIDIGTYNTCGHNCLYCYANSSSERVAANLKNTEQNSPLMVGQLTAGDKIFPRKMKSYQKQGRLF